MIFFRTKAIADDIIIDDQVANSWIFLTGYAQQWKRSKLTKAGPVYTIFTSCVAQKGVFMWHLPNGLDMRTVRGIYGGK